MLRLDLQFYAFFMIVLCGAVLGLLFDLLRVMRGHYRPNAWVGGAADLLFWGAATAAISSGLFYGNWGELRLYVLVGVLLGVGLYYWLASSVVMHLTRLIIAAVEWVINLVIDLILRLIWAPLVFVAGLVWSALQTLWQWTLGLAEIIWRMLNGVGQWLLAPLNGPYRWMRLHYLLTKRRWKRRLRHWLLGPPKNRKR